MSLCLLDQFGWEPSAELLRNRERTLRELDIKQHLIDQHNVESLNNALVGQNSKIHSEAGVNARTGFGWDNRAAQQAKRAANSVVDYLATTTNDLLKHSRLKSANLMGKLLFHGHDDRIAHTLDVSIDRNTKALRSFWEDASMKNIFSSLTPAQGDSMNSVMSLVYDHLPLTTLEKIGTGHPSDPSDRIRGYIAQAMPDVERADKVFEALINSTLLHRNYLKEVAIKGLAAREGLDLPGLQNALLKEDWSTLADTRARQGFLLEFTDRADVLRNADDVLAQLMIRTATGKSQAANMVQYKHRETVLGIKAKLDTYDTTDSAHKRSLNNTLFQDQDFKNTDQLFGELSKMHAANRLNGDGDSITAGLQRKTTALAFDKALVDGGLVGHGPGAFVKPDAGFKKRLDFEDADREIAENNGIRTEFDNVTLRTPGEIFKSAYAGANGSMVQEIKMIREANNHGLAIYDPADVSSSDVADYYAWIRHPDNEQYAAQAERFTAAGERFSATAPADAPDIVKRVFADLNTVSAKPRLMTKARKYMDYNRGEFNAHAEHIELDVKGLIRGFDGKAQQSQIEDTVQIAQTLFASVVLKKTGVYQASEVLGYTLRLKDPALLGALVKAVPDFVKDIGAAITGTTSGAKRTFTPEQTRINAVYARAGFEIPGAYSLGTDTFDVSDYKSALGVGGQMAENAMRLMTSLNGFRAIRDNQLVSHLQKLEKMVGGDFKIPKSLVTQTGLNPDLSRRLKAAGARSLEQLQTIDPELADDFAQAGVNLQRSLLGEAIGGVQNLADKRTLVRSGINTFMSFGKTFLHQTTIPMLKNQEYAALMATIIASGAVVAVHQYAVDQVQMAHANSIGDRKKARRLKKKLARWENYASKAALMNSHSQIPGLFAKPAIAGTKAFLDDDSSAYLLLGGKPFKNKLSFVPGLDHVAETIDAVDGMVTGASAKTRKRNAIKLVGNVVPIPGAKTLAEEVLY